MRRALLPLILALAFGARLGVGLLLPLDGDEAAGGIAAIDILHGHIAVVESGGHYLGAVESYVLAPFIAVFGPTQFAIRFALSVVGVLYVLAMYALGRRMFNELPSPARGGGQGGGLLVALFAALFPLFAVSYGVKARIYPVVLLFIALCLLLTVRIAYPPPRPSPARGEGDFHAPLPARGEGDVRQRRWYDWALFGLAAGVGMWNHTILLLTLLLCALMIGLQLARQGVRRADLRGVAIALVFTVVGFAPWIAYNVATHMGSLSSLNQAAVHHGIRQALKELFVLGIPVFLGAQHLAGCGPGVVSWVFADVVMVGLVCVAIWLRRRSVLALLQLRWTRLAPVDFVLLLLPLTLLSVIIGPFNGAACEPRYLMPAAVPLVAIVALAIAMPWRGRWPVAAAAAIWIAMTAVTGANAIPDRNIFPFFDTRNAVELPRAITSIEAHQPGPMWANYWLARPLQYLSNEQLPVGEYNGYVGFPRLQAVPAAASRPSWLFLEKDPDRPIFEQACAARGITYDRSFLFGLVLYDHLSARLTPDELGWPTTINAT